ncbi:filamentous haemagglutinin family protein [Aquabacterium sp.]|uniref:filamentous haemagglutinin family protein n=1 Tax=Aquabacterium sp. TaxID=1872578 RepID=UPI0025C3B951|nr:filamentous haemagglutinin family protein [Aquabacterium sp.]
MNKHIHRLVFDRRRGMRVPAAETARSAGKAAGGQTRATAAVAAGVLSVLALSEAAHAQVRGSAEGAVSRLSGVTFGTERVSAGVEAALSRGYPNLPTYTADGNWKLNIGDYLNPTVDGKIMTLVQKGQTIILNWDTFDIGQGYELRFEQKTGDRAFNRVYDINPSVINGTLTGAGEIVIENRNGVVFGPGARVQAGSLVATALQLTNDAFLKNFRLLRKSKVTDPLIPAFGGNEDDKNGFIGIKAGAEIKALAGGDVIMVAPRIVNAGVIETPQGQAILAAGKTVYLYAPTDLAQRGLMVAVDNFTNTTVQKDLGTVVNEGVTVPGEREGTVRADRGTINLVGAAIRQKGRLTATTAINGQNGAIYLQAMESTYEGKVAANSNEVGSTLNGSAMLAKKLGVIELAAGSVTEVLPSAAGMVVNDKGQLVVADVPKEPEVLKADATDQEKAAYDARKAQYEADLKIYNATTQKASDTFYRSRIDIIGADITLRSGSKVIAPAGEINVLAADDWQNSVLYKGQSALPRDNSLIRMESGAEIDASGLDNLRLPGSRHQLKGRLFSIELADSPVQRTGVLYRSELLGDARRTIGVGDVSGLYSNWRYTAAELSTEGGIVRMQSQGALDLAAGARVDFSGGSVVYEPVRITTSLLSRDPSSAGFVRLDEADKGTLYSTFLSDPSKATPEELQRLGLTAVSGSGTNVPEVLVGKNAGAALLASPLMRIDAALNGSVVMSAQQRQSTTSSAGILVSNNGLSEQTDASHAIQQDPALALKPNLYTTLRPSAGTLVLGKPVGGSDGVPAAYLGAAVRITGSGTSAMNEAGEFVLPASVIQGAGLGKVDIVAPAFNLGGSDGSSASLAVVPGGRIEVKTLGDIGLNGGLTATGGDIAITSIQGEVNVAKGSSLSTKGTFRDERFERGAANEAVDLTAGSIKLSAGQGMSLNGIIDVSAGAWRATGGGSRKGDAGSVDLSVNTVRPAGEAEVANTLTLGDVRFAGYDFDNGGKVTITGLPALSVGAPAAPGSNALSLNPADFARDGFGTIDISAIGDVTVADGATVAPVLTNYVANRIARGANPLVNVVVQEAGRRAGVNLALTANALPVGEGLAPESLLEGADLKVGTGATIDVGAGGSIALSAGGNLDMDGSLVARGGTVKLAILGQRGATAGINSTDFEPYGYLKDQHIGLGEKALIDVSGIVKSYRPGGASDARLFGEVLGGGTVTLGSANGTPQRGRLLMNSAASIKLDGASGDLDFGRFVDRQRVSAAAGTLNIGLTDGFELLGNLSARAPDATVAGGTVNIALSQERLIDRDTVSGVKVNIAYPKNEARDAEGNIPDNKRTIHLTGTQTQATTFADEKLKFGEGVVSAEALTTSGFDRISLRADHSVALHADANLARFGNSPLQSVVLNAPVIDLADQGVHLVQANHVGMGVFSPAVIQREASPQATTGSLVAAQDSLGGKGVLTLQAGLIEVSGDVAVKGADVTALDAGLDRNGGTTRSNGEIRLIGARELGTSDMTGRLSYAGSLLMRAGQLYATTLSDFTLKGFASSAAKVSTLELVAPAGGSTSQAPLSALASLTLDAHTVAIRGNIHQPFGSIDINATQLDVTESGRLSVNGLRNDGSALIVPVGTTVNETQWVYATQGAVAASGQTETLDPKTNKTLKDLSGLVVDKRIALNGTTLKLDGKSQVDAQAGGDLLAWEFKAGVGGSTDTYNRKGVYAILPSNSYDFAPYDADINASSSKLGKGLSAGSQVTIKTGSSVLAAGTYTLMDARYGILPGAVLVRADSLKTTADLPRAIANDDGSVYVSGFMGGAGTASSTGNPNMVLVLEPEDTFRKQSEVIRTSANAYVDALAKRSGEAILRPGDAGIASFVSSNAFDLLASVNLAGRDGLRGGMLDVAMPDMVVSRSAPAAGKGQVSLDRLNSIGASSILLGGTRENSADGVTVTRKADAVSLVSTPSTEGASDELSTAGELLVVAKKSVKVEDGLRVASTGADTGDSRRYVIKDDGATLLVSNLSKTEVSVTNVSATPSGDLEVGKAALPGSVQLSGNAVQLDATGNLSIDPSTRINTGSLGLGSQRVAVGAVAADKLDASILSLSGELLSNINQSQRLQLRAYQGIDFYRDVTLGSSSMDKMTLDTPQLRGIGNADQVATVKAREVVLTNTTGRAAGTELGTSQLRVEATSVLQDGRTGGLTVATSLPSTSAVTANGQALAFAKTVLDSKGDIVLDGRGNLKARGDLELSAARVSATGKAQQVVDVDGVLTITNREGAKTLGESLGAGGAVALQGKRVEQRGVIDIESGTLDITGAGVAGRNDTVVFAEGSTTSVAGRSKQVTADYVVSSDGGSLSAKATSGNVVVNGLLNASAAQLPVAMNGNVAQAGTVNLQAKGAAKAGEFTAGAVVIGTAAQIKLDAPTASQGGKLAVDAQRVMSLEEAQAVAAGVAFTGSNLDGLAKVSSSIGQALGKVDIRVREGDVVLNTQMRASQVGITADSGKLSLGASGQVIADAAQGGLVQLQSKGDLTLNHGASISARSTRNGANGGDVLLSSTDGTVFLGDATVVADSVGDPLDGRIVVRAGRKAVGGTDADIKVSRLADDGNAGTQLNLQAGQVDLVGVKVYTDAPGTADAQQHKTLTTGNTTTTAWGLNTIKSEADTFLGGSNKANILSGLGLTSAQAHVKAEAEVRALGNFALDTLTGDFNFTPLVSGGEPINLTVRAAGNLSVVDNVSAGFGSAARVAENATAPSSVSAGDAASFRFVAGADTASANLLAVNAEKSAGHFELSGDKHIRTTAGSIEVAAAGDVRLLSSTGTTALPSAIYVAGRLSSLASGESFVTPYTWAQYTERGGRLSISAGGNVSSRNATNTAAQSLTQMTPNFFFHAGAAAGSVAWWTAFDSFRQGFGSFGGGNIDVTAGGDVRDMAVVSLTNARNVALASGGTSLKELGGGDVSVQAGGDIAGGLFVLARGDGRLSAGGSIKEGAGATTTDGTYTSQQVIPSAPLLGLMNGQWAVSAGNDVEVSHVFNPTLLTQALTGATTATRSRITAGESGYYLTYAPTAGASVFSTKGSVTLEPNSQTLRFLTRALNNVAGNVVIPVADLANMAQLAAVLPPVLRLTSYSGDVSIDAAGVEYKSKTNGVTQDVRTNANALAVAPSVSSDVRVYAEGDLSLRGIFQLPDRQQALAVFGASPGAPVASSGLAGMANALNPANASSSLATGYSSVVAGNTSQLVSRPVTDTEQAANPNVVTFAAGRDLRFDLTEVSAISTTYAALRVPRPAELVAGRDLLNPIFMGQNFGEGDVTRLSAGRDVVALDTNVGAVVINGPGQLRIEAGRDILLQQSTGVAAVGNSINQALPDQGAKITLAAGMDRQVNIERATALHGSDAAFRAELRAAVVASQLPPPEGKASWAEATDAEVLSTFGTLTDARQLGALDRFLNARFVAQYLPELAGRSEAYYLSDAFKRVKHETMWRLTTSLASQAVSIAISSDASEEAKRKVQRENLFKEAAGIVDLAGLGQSVDRQGLINLASGRVHNLAPGGGNVSGSIDNSLGGIDVIAADKVLAGLPSTDGKARGFVNFDGGSFRSLTGGDFLAGDQKVIVSGRGNLFIYATDGDIDSGKGSNNAASQATPRRFFNPVTQRVETKGQPSLTGSGFQTIQEPQDIQPRIGLYAPNGEIRALDAFIVGGDVQVAAPVVRGADNISNASGVAPPAAPTVTISITPKLADPQAGVEQAAERSGNAKSRGTVNSQLSVELLGLGAEGEAAAAGDAGDSKAIKDAKDKEKR